MLRYNGQILKVRPREAFSPYVLVDGKTLQGDYVVPSYSAEWDAGEIRITITKDGEFLLLEGASDKKKEDVKCELLLWCVVYRMELAEEQKPW